jgi:hypothetical protein
MSRYFNGVTCYQKHPPLPIMKMWFLVRVFTYVWAFKSLLTIDPHVVHLNNDWLTGWLAYSCCSHLEHRASVERFVSLKFLNLRHSVGLLGRVISPSQGRYLTQTQNKQTDIHASSWIRTHDSSVRASENSSCSKTIIMFL